MAQYLSGAILLIAVFGKSLLFFDGSQDFITGLGTVAQVLVELLFVVLIMKKWRPVLLELILALVFLIFAFANAWLVLEGDRNCGCFGVFHLSPLITFFIDMCLFGFLADSVMKRAYADFGQSFFRSLLVLFVSIVTLSLHFAKPTEVVLSDQQMVPGAVVSVVPKNLIGKEFELAPFLVPVDLEWNLGTRSYVFIRTDCKKCDAAVDYALRCYAETNTIHALVAVDSELTEPNETNLLPSFSMTPDYKWNIPVPLVVTLEEGMVINARRLEKQNN